MSNENIKNLNIFVICNKQKEHNRFINCEKQFDSIDIKKKINIHYYKYIWYDEIDEEIYKKYCKTDKSMIRHGRSSSDKRLTYGELSLVLNMVNCLKKIRDEYNDGYFLILESDFLLEDDFKLKLDSLLDFLNTKNINFDIINIGEGLRKDMLKTYFIENDTYKFNNLKLKRSKRNSCAEGTLWNIKSINKFLNYFEKENDVNGPWDTMLDELNNFIDKEWILYLLFPSLLSQGSIKGLFTSYIH